MANITAGPPCGIPGYPPEVNRREDFQGELNSDCIAKMWREMLDSFSFFAILEIPYEKAEPFKRGGERGRDQEAQNVKV